MTGDIHSLKRIARAGVCVVVLIASLALAGWLLNIPVLTSIVPGWPRMALVVLLCFLISAGAVFELTLPVRHRYLRLARFTAAGLLVAVGLYFLIDFAAGGALIAAAGGLFDPPLGRPSPASAFNFLLAALALLMPENERGGRLYAGLIALGLALTGFDFAGYAYDIAALSRGPAISAMSMPTMLCFVLLFASALLARPRDGWTAVISAPNSGGIAARRLFPAVLVLPFVMNGVVVLAYRFHPFEAQLGFAVLAVLTSIGLCIVTMVIAGWLARHEDERQRSQELLEAIVDNSMAVIYVKDLAGRYVMVNRRYLDVFHLERQAVIGKTDHDLFSKYEADSYRAMDEDVVRAGHAMTGEEIASQADGYHTYLSLKAPLMNAAGRPYATFGISSDITDRMRSQKALAASEEQTRLIVETALDAVVSIDRNGIITGWNSQAEKIFGWPRGTALGRPIDETIMPERYRAAHKRGMARYLDTREARILNKRIEMIALHRDGREFPVELSITPIRSGETTGFSAFIRDITERKDAEKRLQTQLERLALLERRASAARHGD
ncbi:MAG TPA: PAS domain S-box protein [Rhizomicrobium sp.]|nr:PAS domain S-box protein [Rhizomicrobium sp.]